MSLFRKAIRKKVAAVLDAAPSVVATVFDSRFADLWETELPAVLVFAAGENVEIYNKSPLEYKRTIRLGIEIIAAALDGVEDDLDDLAEAVEQVIYTDETLGSTASDSDLTQVDIEIRTRGEVTIAAIILGFEVPYLQTVPDSSLLTLDDLESLGIDWNLAPPDAHVDAQDEITLPIV